MPESQSCLLLHISDCEVHPCAWKARLSTSLLPRRDGVKSSWTDSAWASPAFRRTWRIDIDCCIPTSNDSSLRLTGLRGSSCEARDVPHVQGAYVRPGIHTECHESDETQVVNDRWEIAIGLTDGSGFQQAWTQQAWRNAFVLSYCCPILLWLHEVSFVNSINTSRGGTHVTYIADQVSLNDKWMPENTVVGCRWKWGSIFDVGAVGCTMLWRSRSLGVGFDLCFGRL